MAFNQIHSVLKRLNPHDQNDAFMKLLSEASRRHSYFQSFFVDLKQYAKLRNALVHEKLRMRTYIACPQEEVVLHIEKIARLLTAPPKAMTIASKTVITLLSSHSIEYIIQTMNTSSYNQFPIYQDGKFTFLLTEGGLIGWLAANIRNGQIQLTNHTAAELRAYEDMHNVIFVRKDLTIFEIEDLFEESFQQEKKLEAAIVTETGSPFENPLGIITPWDLIEIDLLDSSQK